MEWRARGRTPRSSASGFPCTVYVLPALVMPYANVSVSWPARSAVTCGRITASKTVAWVASGPKTPSKVKACSSIDPTPCADALAIEMVQSVSVIEIDDFGASPAIGRSRT
eukprot:scaffold284397_cov26-Tisochrysis_lutea.AAC.1